MPSETVLSGFVRMSRYLGAEPAYVQGGGGNTSAKVDGQRMVVKASGLSLSGVTETSGFADVDFQAIRDYLRDPSDHEDDFNAAVIATNTAAGFRPSMETGFHAVLDGYVLHSHSVYANVVNCAVAGPERLARILPDAVWIPYVSPGRALTLVLRQYPNDKMFFLQNHGVVVRADQADGAIAAHEALNQQLRAALALPEFDLTAPPRARGFMDDHILFPDQVIYTNPGSRFDGTTAQIETLAAYTYIHDQMDRLGLAPHYLHRSDAAFLLNMEAEKFRGKVKPS